MSDDSEGGAYRLPVFRTVAETFQFNWQHKRYYFLCILPLAFAITLASDVVSQIGLPQTSSGTFFGLFAASYFGDSWVDEVLAIVVTVFVWVALSVAWHRLYLLQEERLGIGSLLLWRARHFWFLLKVILISLMVLLAVIFVQIFNFFVFLPLQALLVHDGGSGFSSIANIPFVIGTVLFAMYFLIFVPLTLRFSMCLPSAAIDKPFGIWDSWDITVHNGYRLALVFLLAGFIPIWAAEELIYLLSYLSFDAPLARGAALIAPVLLGDVFGHASSAELEHSIALKFVAGWIDNFVWLCGVAIGVSVLSISYMKFISERTLPPVPEA